MFFILHTGHAPAAYPAGSYTFGVVPQYDQRQLFAIWKPLLEELQRRTGLSFKLAATPTIPAFERELLKGGYDFAYPNPYHALKANQSHGYLPIVRDSTNLHGILVVRRDSPVKSPSELDGKVVALPCPNALGASLLMRADLARVHHAKVSPLYAKTHDSVYLHVVKGLADAGGGVEKTLEEQEKPIRDALRIIYTTRDLPSHPIVVSPRIPRTDAEKVRRAFIEMAAAKEGQELLEKVPMKKPVSTSMDEYSPMMKWGLEAFWVEE
ncbi:MAG: phosphate ABC transporter [Geobacteraceae bacterium GWC2_58_44]|nr:MAG: phosphate ABC transporter [Geobacteraceae bacterium GWC2_58_44]